MRCMPTASRYSWACLCLRVFKLWSLGFVVLYKDRVQRLPRPSIYPLLDPKYPLFRTIYPYLRVQGGSWQGLVHVELGWVGMYCLGAESPLAQGKAH